MILRAVTITLIVQMYLLRTASTEPGEGSEAMSADRSETGSSLPLSESHPANCGGKVDTERIIESPLDCNNLNQSYNCEWKIQAPHGKVVAVSFEDMAMEHKNRCKTGSVQLIDGIQSNQNSSLPKMMIAVLCGWEEDQVHYPSGIYKSTGSSMTMFFTSKHMAGFKAYVKFSTEVHHNFTRCGRSRHSPMVPRVVGGRPSRAHAWPWLVSLRYEDTRKHFCAGAIISERWVLSAAHCLQHGRNFFVMAGAHTKAVNMAEAGRQYRNVSKFINHEDYIELGEGPDLALVEVDEPFLFNHKVSAICMAKNSLAKGEKCTVAGWGDTYDSEYDKHLMQVSVPLIPLKICRSRKVYRHHIHEFEICGGHMQGGKDACKGDSGGPLNCDRNGQVEVQGVVSWGENCSKKNRPGIYTKMSHPDLLEWVKSHGVKYQTVDVQ